MARGCPAPTATWESGTARGTSKPRREHSMTEARPAAPFWLGYLATGVIFAAGTFGIVWLFNNIRERKHEALQTSFPLVELTEDSVAAAEWGKNFPRQYDGYLRTVDIERT